MKPERLKREAKKEIAPPAIGISVHRLSSCSSSNDVAREMARKGAVEGTVVVCAEQTAGRGRSGRPWLSVRGKGLYMSVILRPVRSDLTLLSIASGLAVREAIQRGSRSAIQIKWPNDIMVAGRKIAGILCESVFHGDKIGCVILGIGLNLNHLPEDFPPDLLDHAISLHSVSEEPVNSESLLDALFASLRKWYGRFTSGNDDAVLSGFSEHSVFSKGETVRVTNTEGEIRGTYGGLDMRGGLILTIRGGQRIFFDASVRSVNPRGGAKC